VNRVSHKHVVLSIFRNEEAADAAVASLNGTEVHLNAIGVLTLDEHGDVKTRKLGSRSVGKGGSIGTVLAVIAPGVGLGAAVAGGALGALHRKNLGLREDDHDRMSTELASGKVAVGVLVKSRPDAGAIADRFAVLGGKSEIHALSDEWLDHAVAGPPPPPVTG
jgi:hypothetical protein